MIAIPVMRGRVAPVLNWCSRMLIFPATPGEAEGQELWAPELGPGERLQLLQEKGVNILICGALSLDLLYGATHQGLKVISGVAGAVDEVLKAYREDRLGEPEFWLPGCRGPRRYRQGGREIPNLSPIEEPGGKLDMPGGKGGGGQGRGQGRGPGGGRCGRGQGAGGGALGPGTGQGAGTQDVCTCPACGASAPHARGIPCFQVNCPQCGKPMVRK